MRELSVTVVTEKIAQMCIEANCLLPEDVHKGLLRARAAEESLLGCEVMDQIIANADLAAQKSVPICQDTGMTVVFLELGQDLHMIDGDLEAAVHEGVRLGYTSGFLRKSVVRDPLLRDNTGDNTPAVIHIELVSGEQLVIHLAPKGFGSENMGGLAMLKPSEGIKGVEDFVVSTVQRAGSNPCPPIVVGVGIGGTMEKSTLMAKKALLRELGQSNTQTHLAELEQRLLSRINRLGIGPQGFGGTQTALAVHIESYPTHIAGLPVAVNINCHVTRHRTVVL